MNSKIFLTISILLLGLSSGLLFSQDSTQKFKTMNLHDFMEDYVENAEHKFKKGKKDPLLKLLKYMPELAPEKDREEWQEIVTKHIESGELLKSCKACHVKFKKQYKKTYRKKLLEIPEEILK